jgi:Antitoxin ParD
MPQKHHRKSESETIRLTIDFPVQQHTYIKMLAASEGISLRQFVIEHLPGLEKKGGKKKHKDANDEEFNKLLKEFLVEKAPMLKRLSKK